MADEQEERPSKGAQELAELQELYRSLAPGRRPPSDDGPDAVAMEAHPADKPVSRIAVIFGVLAILAGGLVGVFVVAGSNGGGASPEAAVRKMTDAISHTDVVGALDALAPSERDAMTPGIKDVFEQSKRLNLLSGDASLSKIQGVELSFKDLKMETAAIGDGVSGVRITGGTATYSTDLSKLPLGSLLKDSVPKTNTTSSGTTPAADNNGGDNPIVTVREGGRWYVSIFYSAAESARRSAGLSVPSFGHGVAAVGALTPEKAVDDLVRGALDLNLRRVIELMPPDEARALHDYAPLFLTNAETSIADLKSNGGLDGVRLTDLKLKAKTDGDEATVTLASFGFEANRDSQHLSVVFDGRCTTVETGTEHQRSCPEDLTKNVPLFSGGVTGGFTGGIVTVKRDGQWYVSPTRTLFAAIVAVMKKIDPQALQDAKNKGLEGLFGGLSSAFGSSTSTAALPLARAAG
jgi:hypothetical protein